MASHVRDDVEDGRPALADVARLDAVHSRMAASPPDQITLSLPTQQSLLQSMPILHPLSPPAARRNWNLDS